jgi:biopolymer transport protein ExbD
MSFAQPTQPARRAVPFASLLDIMFLLLIFFVTTSSFRQAEAQIDVNLPAAQTSSPDQPRRSQVIVNVDATGSVTIANQQLSSDQLYSLMRKLASQFPDEQVIIRGDRAADFQHIISAMDTVRTAGIQHIYFATVKQASEAGVR